MNSTEYKQVMCHCIKYNGQFYTSAATAATAAATTHQQYYDEWTLQLFFGQSQEHLLCGVGAGAKWRISKHTTMMVCRYLSNFVARPAPTNSLCAGTANHQFMARIKRESSDAYSRSTFFLFIFPFAMGTKNTVCRRNDSLSSCHCMHVEISHTRHSRRTNASFDVKHMCWKSVVWSGQQRQQRWRRRQRRRKLEVFAHFFFHSALAWFAHLTFAGGHGAIAISLHIYIAIILCFIKDQI